MREKKKTKAHKSTAGASSSNFDSQSNLTLTDDMTPRKSQNLESVSKGLPELDIDATFGVDTNEEEKKEKTRQAQSVKLDLDKVDAALGIDSGRGET